MEKLKNIKSWYTLSLCNTYNYYRSQIVLLFDIDEEMYYIVDGIHIWQTVISWWTFYWMRSSQFKT